VDKLKLYQSIPLGIGSIIGSGVLFLPSLTYKVALNDVLVSWILIITLCIPGVFFLKEMLLSVKDRSNGLSSLVELGLGKEVGDSTFILLLGTVIFGMPSAAIIAGEYVSSALNIEALRFFAPFIILLLSFIANLKGIKSSSAVATIITILLLLISGWLIISTFKPLPSYSALRPSFNLGNIYEGAVLAFWAFAGFENLIFMYDKFEKPNRDLIVTIIVSVIFCGIKYVLLVSNYAALIPIGEIDKNIGLLQLAESSNLSNLVYVVGAFAFFAVLINFVSWTTGIVSLIIQVAKNGIINDKIIYCFKTERSPLFLLYIIFTINTLIGLSSGVFFESILKIVSTNFLILYLILIMSYFLFTKNLIKKLFSFFIAIGVLSAISSSGVLLLYPMIVLVLSIIYLLKKNLVIPEKAND
jgi:amino acid efflux transporter